MSKYLTKLGDNAKKAFKNIDTKTKNKVLRHFANSIYKNKNKILLENLKDIRYAKSKGLKENLINRLSLNNEKLDSIIKSIKTVIKLKDPVNEKLSSWKRPNGLKISRVSIPIGVIAVIYESRPNVTADVSTLCFKSGNFSSFLDQDIDSRPKNKDKAHQRIQGGDIPKPEISDRGRSED